MLQIKVIYSQIVVKESWSGDTKTFCKNELKCNLTILTKNTAVSKAEIAQDLLADNVGDGVVTLQIDAYPVEDLLNRVITSTTTTTTTASTTETVKMDL